MYGFNIFTFFQDRFQELLQEHPGSLLGSILESFWEPLLAPVWLQNPSNMSSKNNLKNECQKYQVFSSFWDPEIMKNEVKNEVTNRWVFVLNPSSEKDTKIMKNRRILKRENTLICCKGHQKSRFAWFGTGANLVSTNDENVS